MAYSKIKCPECKKIIDADVSNLFVICPYCGRKIFEEEYGIYNTGEEEDENDNSGYAEVEDPVTFTDILASEGLAKSGSYDDSDVPEIDRIDRKNILSGKYIVAGAVFIAIIAFVISSVKNAEDKDVISQTNKNTIPLTSVVGTLVITEAEPSTDWMVEDPSAAYIERSLTEKIKPGMGYNEVVEILGKRFTTAEKDDLIIASWPLQPYTRGDEEHLPMFEVVFDEYGKVVSSDTGDYAVPVEETEATTLTVNLGDIKFVSYYDAIYRLHTGITYEECCKTLGNKRGVRTNPEYDDEKACKEVYIWNIESFEKEDGTNTGEVRVGVTDNVVKCIHIVTRLAG